MKAKRPSLRGKGADIFLGERPAASVKNVAEVAERIQIPDDDGNSAKSIDKEKATFYLPIEVLDELEVVWHDLRRATHRKIKKSDIVSIALQTVSDEFKAWQSEQLKSCSLIERLSNQRVND